MAFNPFMLRPPDRPGSTKTFTFDGGEFTLTFKKPGQVENTQGIDRGNELILRYLGTDDKPGPGFPPVGGVAVKVNQIMIRNGAIYETMQPEDTSERYSADEFIAMQVSLPDATWNEVAAFGCEVLKGVADVPKLLGEGTDHSSDSLSNTPSGIPNI